MIEIEQTTMPRIALIHILQPKITIIFIFISPVGSKLRRKELTTNNRRNKIKNLTKPTGEKIEKYLQIRIIVIIIIVIIIFI